MGSLYVRSCQQQPLPTLPVDRLVVQLKHADDQLDCTLTTGKISHKGCFPSHKLLRCLDMQQAFLQAPHGSIYVLLCLV
jgi:hypothetical protein